MARFIEPALSRELAEGVRQQLLPIRDQYPGASVRLLGPDHGTAPWRVEVEVDGADVLSVKQACLDLLGE
ncbi:MAG: hypothetical protein ACK47B_03150 [Armatimonadota bacterium]